VCGKILTFAENTKLFSVMSTVDEIELLYVICTISVLVLWTEDWLMLFNVKKCILDLETQMLIILEALWGWKGGQKGTCAPGGTVQGRHLGAKIWNYEIWPLLVNWHCRTDLVGICIT